MWREITPEIIAAGLRAEPALRQRVEALQQQLGAGALSRRHFWNNAVDEDDPEDLRTITVIPYAQFPPVCCPPLLWERYSENRRADASPELFIGLLNRQGDHAHAPLSYDDRRLYFCFLWEEAAGCGACVEDDHLITYWCRDLADFLSQLFDEGPDEVIDL